jgi:AhpD family alkylhydroperoxidase
MSRPPKRFQKFTIDHPNVARAYEQLGEAVHEDGPLDAKTRALVKIAVSTGRGLEGAVHSHVHKALNVGVTRDEIHHAVLLSLPTIGLPAMMAALSWVDDVLQRPKVHRKRK